MEPLNLDSRNVCPIWLGHWEQPPGCAPCGDESQDTSRLFPKESHKTSPSQRHFYGPAIINLRSERQLDADPCVDIPGKAGVPCLCSVSQKCHLSTKSRDKGGKSHSGTGNELVSALQCMGGFPAGCPRSILKYFRSQAVEVQDFQGLVLMEDR